MLLIFSLLDFRVMQVVSGSVVTASLVRKRYRFTAFCTTKELSHHGTWWRLRRCCPGGLGLPDIERWDKVMEHEGVVRKLLIVLPCTIQNENEPFLFVGHQLCGKDHLVFIYHALCMYTCMDVDFSSTSKGKPSLSNANAVTDFHQIWYVGSGGAQVLPMWSVVTECAYLIPYLHICSDWLITKSQISRVLYGLHW